MCDYSLEYEVSRPAKVGEKLRIQRFNLGTRGFASPTIAERRFAFFREQNLLSPTR